MTERYRWMTTRPKLLEARLDFFRRDAQRERQCFQHHVDRACEAGELGLLCASIPEEYGGGGGTFAHEAALVYGQMRAQASSFGGQVHSAIIAHYLNGCGTEAQKQEWLPKMATGEVVTAIAMTEPGTGSDLQAIRTTAIKDGDEYVINGSKTFITNGLLCDLVVVVAKTDPAEGAKGISSCWSRPTARALSVAATWRRWANMVWTPASCSSTTSGCRPPTCSAAWRVRGLPR